MMEKGHPQTRAETIGKYGCLAFCYIYWCGIDPMNYTEYFRIVSDAIDAGVAVSGIAEDCTFENPDKFIKWLSGRDVRVTHEVLCSIKNIKEPTIVRYYYINADAKKIMHFVVVEQGQIVFNPLQYSYCVEVGRPDSARIINLI